MKPRLPNISVSPYVSEWCRGDMRKDTWPRLHTAEQPMIETLQFGASVSAGHRVLVDQNALYKLPYVATCPPKRYLDFRVVLFRTRYFSSNSTSPWGHLTRLWKFKMVLNHLVEAVDTSNVMFRACYNGICTITNGGCLVPPFTGPERLFSKYCRYYGVVNSHSIPPPK